MPFEEIEVRITREGNIFVDTRGLEPERIRSIVEYLRETVGPDAQIITDPDDMPPQRINLDEARREAIAERLEGERDAPARERLRDGGG